MGDEVKFQQRWEFRRKDNDFDSSSNDSKSSASGEPVLERHQLVSGLISLDEDETSNARRPQLDHPFVPALECQIENGKAEEKNSKRSKKNNLANSEMKMDSHKGNNGKKSKIFAYDPAAFDDVKSSTESLLEGLKAARESLFTWMREEMNKLVADDNTSASRKRRNGTSGRKKVQLKHHTSKKMRVQHQNGFEKNLRFQHQNNSKEITQEQHLNSMVATVHVQQENNFDNIEGQKNNLKSGMRAENCSDGSLQRFVRKAKETDDANSHFQTVDHQVDYVQGNGSMVSTEKEKEKRLALNVNSKFESNPSDQNFQVEHPKTVVLAISAPNFNDGSSVRSLAGKKTADYNKRSQVPEDRVGYRQQIGSMTSRKKDEAEKLRLLVEQSFPPKLSNQVASSIHLTSPTIFPKPHDSSIRLDTSFCNFIQPTDAGNKTNVVMERVNQMPDFSTHCGYLPCIEEGIGSFAQMASRNMSFFDQHGTPISSPALYQAMEGGFIIPGQFYTQNFPLENCNTLGLSMNGGATTFSGRSNELSEHLAAKNLHSHFHKADSRLFPYPIASIKDGYLLPK